MSNHNPELTLALEYVQYTRQNIFLTGKAGTGKTTFLHSLKHNLLKRMVVVAPTGVAAIHAGGMTIHSFFQLPFGPCVPGAMNQQRQFRREKIRMIRNLDLLIIDEISMVRADVLDGIDEVLRRYRDRRLPFGGVQLLMIGDLHQLPPVVKDEEWRLLSPHYDTAYFFGSKALRETHPITIELKHIYRQADETFIALLNKVRDNRLDDEVLRQLNSRYIPDFQPPPDQSYITLTAHNQAAREINGQRLSLLAGRVYTFSAEIGGTFPEYAYPTDEVLEIKIGAQVMFVKNDPSPEKRYFNGKIGTVREIGESTITVQCPGDTEQIVVQRDTWKNIQYTLHDATQEISEEVIGTFIQYPLKLAWAITIHKSQGLTFERAIIDAEAAFAHGQVYVALSRCKSFEGIVLRSRIAYTSVKTDGIVRNYTADAEKNAPDERHLWQAKVQFQADLISQLFDFQLLIQTLTRSRRAFETHDHTLAEGTVEQWQTFSGQLLEEIITPADKFMPMIGAYAAQGDLPEANEALQTRIRKASLYFTEKTDHYLSQLSQVRLVTDNQTARKALEADLLEVRQVLYIKKVCFEAVRTGFEAQAYLKTRARAESEAETLKPVSPPALVETGPPDLYRMLETWRNEIADEQGVEAHRILPRKTLQALVTTKPLNLVTLKAVPGIGPAKVRQYGPVILSIIQSFVGVPPADPEPTLSPDLSLPKPVRLTKPLSRNVSLELFQAGNTPAEVAQIRGFAESTIMEHLVYFVGTGELEIDALVALDRVRDISDFFRAHPEVTLTEAKQALNETYSYNELRMVREYLRHLGDIPAV